MTFDLDFKGWADIFEKREVERAFQVEAKTRDLKGLGNSKNTGWWRAGLGNEGG